MDKRALAKNLDNAQRTRDAIINGISTIEEKLADLRARAADQLAKTGDTDFCIEISTTETNLELRRTALVKANEAVSAAQREFDDCIAAERYTEAANLHKEFRAVLNQLSNQLGDAGLNGLINQAFDIADQIYTIVGRDTYDDIGMDLRKANFILTAINQNLFRSWQDMRALPWVGERTGGGDSAYYKPGFGRTYS